MRQLSIDGDRVHAESSMGIDVASPVDGEVIDTSPRGSRPRRGGRRSPRVDAGAVALHAVDVVDECGGADHRLGDGVRRLLVPSCPFSRATRSALVSSARRIPRRNTRQTWCMSWPVGPPSRYAATRSAIAGNGGSSWRGPPGCSPVIGRGSVSRGSVSSSVSSVVMGGGTPGEGGVWKSTVEGCAAHHSRGGPGRPTVGGVTPRGPISGPEADGRSPVVPLR